MLHTVTLTGVDDATDLDHLLALSKRYPFLEWGVLLKTPYSRDARSGRYPSLPVVQEIARLARQRDARFALHACKDAGVDILDGRGPAYDLAQAFPRVQLNLRFSKEHIGPLMVLLQRHAQTTFITQHNTANFNLWPALSEFSNYAVLFDRSLGRGVAPSIWPCAIAPVSCGYAGGLGVHNLVQQLPRIEAASVGAPYWLDMESSLRGSRDRLDLNACAQVADLAVRLCESLQAP